MLLIHLVRHQETLRGTPMSFLPSGAWRICGAAGGEGICLPQAAIYGGVQCRMDKANYWQLASFARMTANAPCSLPSL